MTSLAQSDLAVKLIEEHLTQARSALDTLIASPSVLAEIVGAAGAISEVFRRRGRVYTCGNGGSMCDAMHFAEELSGRYRNDRPALGATAISDPSHLSCVANDYGYEFVFSRYIEGHGRPGDLLVGITTSGKSPNILRAAEAAKKLGMTVIGLTGAAHSPLAALADISICTAGTSGFADRIQELHIKVIHILIDLVERELFGADTVAADPG